MNIYFNDDDESELVDRSEEMSSEEEESSEASSDSDRSIRPLALTLQAGNKAFDDGCKVDTRKIFGYEGVITVYPIYEHEFMQLFVKTFQNRTITIRIHRYNTVYTLKKKISEKEGIEIEQQWLIFSGRQLDDEQLLTDYHIGVDATIQVMARLRGC
jgi:hypothetical protein